MAKRKRRYDEDTPAPYMRSGRHGESRLRSPPPPHYIENHRQHDESGATGIINIGNTCFMNSMLQCLSNTKPLRDFCLNSRYRDDINPSSKMRGNLLTGFADLIRQLWTPGQDVINPKHFKTQIQKFSPRFLGHEQQDSQEFLRFLLEGLHEEINQVRKKSSKPIPEMDHLDSSKEKAKKTWEWYKGKDDSFIFDMFVGQLESALKCKECNNISLTYDPFWDLSVPVTKAHTPSGTTIEDCLHSFTKEETLDDDEKPFCDRCKTRRRMSKKLSIHKFPPILVLHLKRFSEGGRFRQKLSSLVKFPPSLSLVPYASRSYEDDIPPVYDLYAVSNHIGSCYGGHYTAYCSNPTTKQWNSFNDSSVKPMSESSACTKEAYVLFYQLRTKSSRL